MTTPPPTGPDPAAAGLPDLAVLTALANEFFSTPPGGTGPVVGSFPASPAVPASPPGALPRGGADLPTAGLPVGGVPSPGFASPSFAQPEPPATPGSFAAPSAPVPSELPTGSAPSAPVLSGVPSVGPAAPQQVPSSPYYFLTEAGTQTPPGLGSDVPPVPLGESELQALLTVLPAAIATPEPAAPEHRDRYYLRAVPEHAPDPHPAFDVHAVRRDFPILSERVNGRQLVWLDNAATTQKPRAVIDRIVRFYEHENSNIHRAAHELAARATDAYEGARTTVARFLGAGSAQEIVFVRGATEGINLIAQSWGRQNVHEGDEILVSHLEHHANIVPWQRLATETGAVLKVIPVDDSGQLRLDEYHRLLSDKTKLVAVTQVSNALGTITPAKEIVALGHRAGACVLIDGAQSVPHLRVNVQDLDADFFVFSGHKIFGPTGIGVVYGKAAVLEAMPPWQAGGNMIRDVTLERSVYQDAPMRFEAGTGNIADAVGLGAALDYLERIGRDVAARYEDELLHYATGLMRQVPGLTLIGTAAAKASVLSFTLDGYTTEQVGQALSREGIAVRAGHHCAQPILRRFGLEATVRPSLTLYNTTDEIDQLVGVLHRLVAGGGRTRT